MPTASVRHGRPKGTGLDDSKRLASVAALLAANPKLKPTTAIRSLGIEDPSDIRRLRDKFHSERSTLMAHARKKPHANGVLVSTKVAPQAKAGAAAPARDNPIATVVSQEPAAPLWEAAPGALLAAWCGFGLGAFSAAVENQAVLAQHWLRLPPVSMALRNQLAFNAFALAIYQRRKAHSPRLN